MSTPTSVLSPPLPSVPSPPPSTATPLSQSTQPLMPMSVTVSLATMSASCTPMVILLMSMCISINTIRRTPVTSMPMIVKRSASHNVSGLAFEAQVQYRREQSNVPKDYTEDNSMEEGTQHSPRRWPSKHCMMNLKLFASNTQAFLKASSRTPTVRWRVVWSTPSVMQ